MLSNVGAGIDSAGGYDQYEFFGGAEITMYFTAKSYEEANAAEIKSARRPVSVSAAADDKNRIVEAVKKISIDVKDAQAYIEVVRADSKASSDQIASALDCQGKLARFLVGQQTASSSSSTRAMTKFKRNHCARDADRNRPHRSSANTGCSRRRQGCPAKGER